MSRLRRALRGASADFLEADTRMLASFRIVFGLLLTGYVLFVPVGHRLDAYFTDAGLYPLDLLANDHPDDLRFSLFRFVRDRTQASAYFGVAALLGLMFAAGAWTRITGPLAVLATISIHHRVPFVVNGSMVMMHLIGLWSVLLPLGRHASVDAWLASRRGESRSPLRVRSLAVLGFRLQLFVVYYFNVVHKTGATWRDGTAVHYVLWQQRAALPTAIALRHHEPRWFSPVASYGTLAVELALAALVLLPVWRRPARRLAAALMVLLHGAFATMLDLGPFPFVFATAALLLLASEDGAQLPACFGGGLPAVDERREGSSKPGRWLREVVLGFFLLHATYTVWEGNPGMVHVFGTAPSMPFLSSIRQALFIPQTWHLFAPDAPTGDVVLMPTVVLANGRHVDVRRRATPDFDLLDGRFLEPDFYDQTFDARFAMAPTPARCQAYADYLARVPELERWPGERRVTEVMVHVLRVQRPPLGSRASPVPLSDVPCMRSYPTGAPPVP